MLLKSLLKNKPTHMLSKDASAAKVAKIKILHHKKIIIIVNLKKEY